MREILLATEVTDVHNEDLETFKRFSSAIWVIKKTKLSNYPTLSNF